LAFPLLNVGLREESGASGDLGILENLSPEAAIDVSDCGLNGHLILGCDVDVAVAAGNGGVFDVGDGDIQFRVSVGALINRQRSIRIETSNDGIGDRHLELWFQAGIFSDGNVNAVHALDITTGNISDAIPRATAQGQNNTKGESAPQNGLAHGVV